MAHKHAPGISPEPHIPGRIRAESGIHDAGSFECGKHYTLNGDVKSEQFDNAVLKGTNVKLVKVITGANGVLECIVELGNGLRLSVEGGMLTTQNDPGASFSGEPPPGAAGTPNSGEDMENFSVEFSLATAPVKTENGMVRRRARVFTTGDYPDKKFSLNDQEAKDAEKDFRPVDLDLEHLHELHGIPTVLTGQLGKLASIKVGAPEEKDGKKFTPIDGEVDVPEWFDKTVPDDRKKLSIQFDRKTKRVNGCSWTLNPRISNAEIFAAFSARVKPQDDPNKSTPVQGGGDGAPPYQRQAGPVEHGNALFQKICDMVETALSDAGDNSATFSRSYTSILERICELAEKGGAKKQRKPATDDAGAPRPSGAALSQDAISPSTAFSDTDEYKSLQAQVAAERKKRIEAEANVFFSSLISDRKNMKATPAEKEVIVAAYVQAAMDDAGDKVAFSEGKSPRLNNLRAIYASRQPLSITQEISAGGQPPAAFALDEIGGDSTPATEPTPDGKQMSEARANHLMAKTRLGERVVASKN